MLLRRSDAEQGDFHEILDRMRAMGLLISGGFAPMEQQMFGEFEYELKP